MTDAQPAQHTPNPARSTKKTWPKPLRRFLWVVDVVLLAGLAWMAWAVVAFYQFRSGLQEGNRISLERQIEWSSVLDGLRADVQAASTSPGGDSEASASDALLTRNVVLSVLRTARLDGRGSQVSSSEPRVFNWRQIKFAFFSGSPFAFRVDVAPDGGEAKRPLILLFQWHGDWRLTRVFLPADADVRSIRQAFLPRADSPVAQQRSSTDAQRAALFEENPPSQQGRRYTGTVAWRTDATPAAAGGQARRIIAAQVAIPGRPLAVTVTLRRNLTLPAIDIIEVRFHAPPYPVQDVLGIMAKPSEEMAGEQLTSTTVKVSDDLFLIGLSAAENDVKRNMQSLMDSPWLGIPFVYSSGIRAVLAFEQGRAGAKSIADALTR